MKPDLMTHGKGKEESLPVRERGLKQPTGSSCNCVAGSLPVRERGLKQMPMREARFRRPSLPVRERGLKQELKEWHAALVDVAPRAGAWIEAAQRGLLSKPLQSLPVRERGLKQHRVHKNANFPHVAPRAGAWIEAG